MTTQYEKERKQLLTNQEESKRLLKACKNQVGSVLGQEIDEHLAALEGRRLSPAVWNVSDRNGEQG